MKPTHTQLFLLLAIPFLLTGASVPTEKGLSRPTEDAGYDYRAPRSADDLDQRDPASAARTDDALVRQEQQRTGFPGVAVLAIAIVVLAAAYFMRRSYRSLHER